MSLLERFLQKCHEWSLRRLARRVTARLKRSVKRRMRGERHRQWMERNLHDSEAGVVLDITQSAVNLMMVGTIIDQNWTKSAASHKDWYLIFDIANLLSIFVNFTFRLYAASNRKGFFLQWLSLIDIATVVPLLVFAMDLSVHSMSNRYLYRFLLMMRTIRILQIFRLLRLAKSARTRQGLLLGFTILCIVICGAIAFQARQTIEYCDPTYKNVMVENISCQNLSFLDSVYLVCITIGTVGFGDFVPKTKVGKLADIFLIVIAGIAISKQIGGYTDILSRETALDKKYVPNKSIQHILLCGEIDNSALRFFLHSWLNTEGERGNRKKVVILAPALPSNNLRRVLIEREYEQRVVYIQGSAMVTADLLRAGAPSAACCFVLYDNARHVNISGASAVVCLEQLRLAIFGKSLWMRGFNAFLGNLIERFIVAEESSGCSHRVYEVCLPQCLRVVPTFAALAVLIYREFNVPIVGLRTAEEAAVVFPVTSRLSDVNVQSVFVIAKSKEVALKIGRMTASALSRHADLLPQSAGDTARTFGSWRAGFLISAIEGKFPFRGRGDDGRSVKSARGPASVVSIKSAGRRGSRSDRITPLASGDDYGDCPIPAEGARVSSNKLPEPKVRVSLINFSTLAEPGLSATEDEDSETIHDDVANRYKFTVLALSPADLMRKASSPPLDDSPSPSPTATSYHTNTNGNGVPIDAAVTRQLSSVQLEPPQPQSARRPDANSESGATSSTPHEPAVVRRRSAEMRDLRLRRMTLLRSFRRAPPPATLERHFVVCGTPSNYADFLANLSDLDEPVAPVVFVTPKDLNEKDHDAYTLYPNLYFVRGSPVSMRTFHEARMLFARSILIMAYCASEGGLEQAERELEPIDENMADVDAITTHRFISNACQSTFQRSRLSVTPGATTPFVVVEMVKPSNAKFLVDRSGSLYDDRSAENEFRAREALRDVKSIDGCLFSPLYASGHVYFPNVVDALLGSCSHHTLLIEMVTQLVTSGNMSKRLPSHDDSHATHRLTQLPAPTRFHFRPYAMLVEGLLREENVMALGMYRNVSSLHSPAHVLTNPSWDELVTPHDFIFAIV
ncbi:hypothetical protein PybrP1_006696 [[Pythium] brassicae (nom. inval.)]|nr:hypothetical protein PybrP1_006696 [[Pythium] brassicae (nom. inval.)]